MKKLHVPVALLLASTLAAAQQPSAPELSSVEAVIRSEVERQEAVLVRRARNRGASWAAIATVLGVTRQAVHKKHGAGWRRD